MCTKEIVTDRLLMYAEKNERDNAAFLEMLETDGDFEIFCGFSCTKAHLKQFDGYLNNPLDQVRSYALFLKAQPETFIGYVGIHKAAGYELEFYIAKAYRKRGYCTEACRAMFEREDFSLKKIYATTLAENVAAIRTLEGLGFQKNTKSAIRIMEFFIDPESGEGFTNQIQEFVLKNEREE